MTESGKRPQNKKASKTNTGSKVAKSKKAPAADSNTPVKNQQKRKPVNGRSLQIKAGIDKKLSPSQSKFNKLIKQIERLQSSIRQETGILDQMLDYYRNTVVPFLPREKATNIRYLKTLFSFYKRKRKELTKEEHNLLRELLLEIYETAVEMEVSTDPELMAIHKKLYGQHYDQTVAEDFELLKIETLAYLRMNDVDVADDIFDEVQDMEQMQEKVVEIMDEYMKKRADDQSGSRARSNFGTNTGNPDLSEGGKKKGKQAQEKLRREQQKADLKQKSISSIYKQLAKIFHPDLEPDHQKKLEKEALMKELTHAYQQKDLHMLLRLELGWIHKEENNIHQLADNQLSLYIEILQEQASELKMQAQSLKWHPRYAPVMEFNDGFFKPSLADMKASFRNIQRIAKSTEVTIDRLDKNDIHSINTLKKIIQEFAIERAFWDDDDGPYDDDFDIEEIF